MALFGSQTTEEEEEHTAMQMAPAILDDLTTYLMWWHDRHEAQYISS
jgi:hypothetical protein